MPFYEYIAIGLMVVFILALFTGYPVAWLLAGLSLLFATIGITLGDMGYDTFLMTSWAKFSGVIDRFDSIMSNWVLVSLPMFVYMGLMLDKSGVADTMMRNFVKVSFSNLARMSPCSASALASDMITPAVQVVSICAWVCGLSLPHAAALTYRNWFVEGWCQPGR